MPRVITGFSNPLTVASKRVHCLGYAKALFGVNGIKGSKGEIAGKPIVNPDA